MKYFFIHNSLGKIIRSGYCSDDDFNLQISSEDEYIVEGYADPSTQKYVDGKIINRPEKPSDLHTWDIENFCWSIDIESIIKNIRVARNLKLRATDWIDLPSASERISKETLEKWKIYRQSLRDITINMDPTNVVWPEPPEKFIDPFPQSQTIDVYKP